MLSWAHDRERQVILDRLGNALQLQRILPESIDMAGLIRTQESQRLSTDPLALCCQLMDHLGHGHYIVEDHQVGHQMIVLENLALLFAAVLGNNALTSKEDPFQKGVKGFTLVHGALDRSPQIVV